MTMLCVRSLHGRAGSILGAVSYHKKMFVLTGGDAERADGVPRARGCGPRRLTVHLGENLGMANERIAHGTAAELADQSCGDLAVLLIEHPDAVNAMNPCATACSRAPRCP